MCGVRFFVPFRFQIVADFLKRRRKADHHGTAPRLEIDEDAKLDRRQIAHDLADQDGIGTKPFLVLSKTSSGIFGKMLPADAVDRLSAL